MNPKIGLLQGIGLVVASMIGSGIFVSSGFMLQASLSPFEIMLEWIIGGLWAFSGAILYVHIAKNFPKNGGEPAYIKEYLDPNIGQVVAILTIAIGFICPIAFDTLVAASYLQSIFQLGNPTLIASVILICFMVLNLYPSKASLSDFIQQGLVLLKIIIVLTIGIVGLNWLQSTDSFSPYQVQPVGAAKIKTLLQQQYWVVYAFSGFNASIYLIERFRKPKEQVKYSMYFGIAFVFVCYLLLNHVFVQMLQHTDIAQVAITDNFTQITLGHILLQKMMGPSYGTIMSCLMVVIFLSSISVMMQLVLPICVSVMGDFRTNKEQQLCSQRMVLWIGGLSLMLIWISGARDLLSSISFLIYFVSSLTVSLILFNRLPQRSPIWIRALSFVYIVVSMTLLAYGMTDASYMETLLFLVVTGCAWLFFRLPSVFNKKLTIEEPTPQPMINELH